jgi:hypothetical protein
VTGKAPRFLDEQSQAIAPRHANAAIVAAQLATVVETPILSDAQQDGPAAIGVDWSPGRLATRRAPYGSAAYAASGLAISLRRFHTGNLEIAPAFSLYQTISEIHHTLILSTSSRLISSCRRS